MWIKPKVIAIDETEYWCDEVKARAKGKIYTLYIYDSNTVTHLCSFEGSYWLEPLETLFENYNLTQEDYEYLEDEARKCQNSDYYNTRDIDRMNLQKTLLTQRCKKDEYDECWGYLRDYYRGNPPYIDVREKEVVNA